jgi:hypothetical protein
VHHEATVTPVIDDDYRRIMQSRTMEASTTSRGVKIMDKIAGKNQQFIVPNLERDSGFGVLVRFSQTFLYTSLIFYYRSETDHNLKSEKELRVMICST